MTVTYSLDVSKARFCGFTKLLARWKGSIYKILWKEFLVFCVGYATISIIYRCSLNAQQRELFEKVVLFIESAIDFIPLSFVLGFYVTLVIGRWWAQYEAIPWPDRLCLMIASYVHGADERSRMIRRTLARYLILLQALTFQAVSTSVKRRFPTTQHLVAAGIMTKEEQSVYDKIFFVYGKWWVPCQWFTSLVMRAKKEGRIKDSILLEGIFKELLNYRSACGTMLNYDWISVPLVYTQVVTLATYIYAAALIVGRQYLDTSKGYKKHEVDLYIPIFTMMQFFFYVGWLKVAEQIVNPYGDDDDDFELNWCLDRTVHVVYLIVDHLQTKHPKIRKDFFWDEIEPRLPQTKHSAKGIENPQLGSAFNLEVEEAEYLPMDSFLEPDEEANMYTSDSVAQRNNVSGFRSSFIMKLFNSVYGQSFRRKSVPKSDTKSSIRSRGYDNPSFVPNQDKSALSTPAMSRKSSFMSFMRKASPSQSRTSSISFHPNSAKLRRHKSYELQEIDKMQQPNGFIPDFDCSVMYDAGQQTPTQAVRQLDEILSGAEHSETDSDTGGQRMENLMPPIPEEPSRTTSLTTPEKGIASELDTGTQRTEYIMPSIPEESSRPTSLASVGTGNGKQQEASTELEDVQNLIKEANEVLKELNRTISPQGHRRDCELKGYESCCSITSDVSSDESGNESSSKNQKIQRGSDTVIVIDDEDTPGQVRGGHTVELG